MVSYLDNDNCNDSDYYITEARWMIGPNPSSNAGGVWTAEWQTIFWPSQLSEWEYWDGDEFRYDPELTVTGKIETNPSHAKKVSSF